MIAPKQTTTKVRMAAVLDAIANGQIEVAGHRKGDLRSLDGKVLDLSDAPDGTLKKGDVLQCCWYRGL